MADIENITQIAMEIVTFAGMAKSMYMQALAVAKKGNFEEAETMIKEGDQNFVEAHHAHLEILQNEMETLLPQISLLMAHAEDQLMGAETLKMVILELIDIYKGGFNNGRV